jgi:hypothetical protein
MDPPFRRFGVSIKPRAVHPTTPAMAAGVADHVWTLEEIAGLLG